MMIKGVSYPAAVGYIGTTDSPSLPRIGRGVVLRRYEPAARCGAKENIATFLDYQIVFVIWANTAPCDI
ncbi:hypothetical protein GCM10009841_08220 [Microlunatus panaciterrae]